jgi:hypothetical protein
MDDANADFRRVTHARGTLAGGERPASRGESGIPRGRSCDIVPAGTDAYLVAPARRGLHRDTRAGYFVVLGPAGAGQNTAGNDARRFGPLATREQAEWLQASARAIGLLDGRQSSEGSGSRPTARLLQPKFP